MINIDKLREELTFDEGCLYEIYEDHLGYATFGIGHLVLDSDAEFGKEIGTPVSEERVIECFEQDIENVFNDLDRNISWWRDLSEDLQRVVANMCFNLGINRLLKFKKFLIALENKDWEKSAIEMMDSKWAEQVGDRAVRLRDRVLQGD
jgi:lysozyme|tara:strand:- start:9102 stop:9548 length:447 start_codon:yes stop_codon:yes gene_type:complete